MQLLNNKNSYGWASICLHWVGAVGLIWLYILGQDIVTAKELGVARELRRALTEYHVSIGCIFLVFFVARIVFHIAQRQPNKPQQHKTLNLISKVVVWGFLLLIFAQVVTGPLIEWSAMRPVKFFDLFAIPSPFEARINWMHKGGEFIHEYAANMFWPLIILHVGGGLKHLLWGDDNIFKRIFWVRNKPSQEG